MKNKIDVITIDGPVGVGKSTVAKIISQKIGYTYLDTGAMYRAFSLKVLRNNIPVQNHSEIVNLCNNTTIEFKDDRVILDGEDVTELIRTKEVESIVSIVASIPKVREFIVSIQKEIASNGKVVMEGRDCGTVISPNAKYKFYLDASVEERAKRRFNDQKYSNQKLSLEEVKKSIEERDYLDKTRKDSPLRIPEDAIVINTDGLSIEDVVKRIMEVIEKGKTPL